MFSAHKILYSQEAFVVNKFDSGLDPTIVECLSEIVYPDRWHQFDKNLLSFYDS